MLVENPGTIINQLTYDVLLAGSWILKDVERVKENLSYRDGDQVFTYTQYYHILLDEVERMSSIQLKATVTPGTSRAYLIDLTSALETVLDEIEVTTNRVLFFQSKIKAARTNIGNLNNSFKAWYLITLQTELKRFEIKLPSSSLNSLSESEFNRLMGDTLSDLDALEQALALLADRLKSRKKLSQDKYAIGKDQVNMSLLPQLGTPQGYNGDQDGSYLLKSRYGLMPHEEEVVDRTNMVLDEPPARVVGKRKDVEPLVAVPEPEGRVATKSDFVKTGFKEAALPSDELDELMEDGKALAAIIQKPESPQSEIEALRAYMDEAAPDPDYTITMGGYDAGMNHTSPEEEEEEDGPGPFYWIHPESCSCGKVDTLAELNEMLNDPCVQPCNREQYEQGLVDHASHEVTDNTIDLDDLEIELGIESGFVQAPKQDNTQPPVSQKAKPVVAPQVTEPGEGDARPSTPTARKDEQPLAPARRRRVIFDD